MVLETTVHALVFELELRANLSKEEIELRQKCFAGAFATLLSELFSGRYDAKDIMEQMTKVKDRINAEMKIDLNMNLDDMMRPN